MLAQKLVGENALSALASDIKSAVALKANSADVYPKTDTYTKQETDDEINEALTNILPKETVSGSIATFSTSLELPLVAMSAEIVAQQASGTPTPSSPLPISGFSSVILTHTGKNLVNVANVTIPNSSSTTVVWEGCLRGTFSISFDKTKITSVEYPTLAFLVVHVDGALVKFAYNNDNIIVIGTIERIEIYGSQAYARVVGTLDLQVESGSTATAYEAYNGETKTIALGQTVYGGVLDVINGKLTITHARVDMGTLNWVYNETYQLFRVQMASVYKPRGSMICEAYPFVGIYSDMTDKTLGYIFDTHFAVKDSTYGTNADAFKTAMTNHYIVYELATPTEITGLTGVNFETLNGTNNIFADCGDIEVTFKQGIQEYIDAKIAATQT